MTDIEIAENTKLENIDEIASKLGISKEEIEQYGKYKAKISNDVYESKKNEKDGKLILVTAISPTPLGEGKTTVSIAIADGLRKIGKNSILTLREPSLGPVFGIKGGATGGGRAQVAPMVDINLHFTGDIHAITSANNLLSSLIDNHIYHGNELKFKRVIWKRCVDLNDRQLRRVETGLSGEKKIVPRMDNFDISVASEIMAIVCLSESLKELKEKLGNIIVGYNDVDEPIYAKQLNANGAMAVLLKDAIKPNLVQTLEHTPALIHGGPFANIAHGCNSIIATKMALKLSDYVITEAGFGADLGAEKFLDIKCRKANIKPNAVVIVATVKALKYHGGVSKEDIQKDIEVLKSLDLQHVSYYSLILEEGTILKYKNYQPLDEENEYQLTLFIDQELEKIGFEKYEISNYAKQGYQSKHNLMYWYYNNYYGIGLGACSKIDGQIIEHSRSLTKYLNGDFKTTTIDETKEETMFNQIMMSLRLKEGLDLNKFKERYQEDARILYKEAITRNIEKGRLMIENDYLKATQEGQYVLNDILIDFM